MFEHFYFMYFRITVPRRSFTESFQIFPHNMLKDAQSPDSIYAEWWPLYMQISFLMCYVQHKLTQTKAIENLGWRFNFIHVRE